MTWRLGMVKDGLFSSAFGEDPLARRLTWTLKNHELPKMSLFWFHLQAEETAPMVRSISGT